MGTNRLPTEVVYERTKYSHPLVHEFLGLLNADPRSFKTICHQSGVSYKWLEHIRSKTSNPRLTVLDQLLRVMGYKLAIVRVTPYLSESE